MNAPDRWICWLEERAEFVCLVIAYSALAGVLAIVRRTCKQCTLSELEGSLPHQFAFGFEILESAGGCLLLSALANLACFVICCKRASLLRDRLLLAVALWVPWNLLAYWIFLRYRPFS
jgi:hypothetical protein